MLDRSAVERETSTAREQIFMEAVDCFCCMIPKRVIREKLISVIAEGASPITLTFATLTRYCNF